MKFDFEDIFITGSNGWLGRQIVESLNTNDSNVLDLEKPSDMKINCFIMDSDDVFFFNKYKHNINLIKGDLRNQQDIKKFLYSAKKSLLIHTVGTIHPKKIKDFYEINYYATIKLVEEAIKKDISKIIVISSNSPLGYNPNNRHLFNENSPYNPYMNYGKSKELMEKYLLKKIKQDINITILRPPWFYGENMPERQMIFYKMVISGKFPIIGNGLNIRSLANVKNICQAIFLASIKEISKGKIYWIADEKNLNMLQIIDTIQKVFINEFKMEVNKSIIRFPYLFGQIFEFLDFFLQKLNIYSQKIHVLSELNKNIACDISLARRELGYNPKVDLYNGTKNAYKQYLKLNKK